MFSWRSFYQRRHYPTTYFKNDYIYILSPLKYSQENTSIEEISKDWLWNLMSNVGIVGINPAI